MIEPCKYCLRPIDTRGMPSHIHFRHLSYVQREFCLTPWVWITFWLEQGRMPPNVSRMALPAPRPGTRYGVKRTMLRGKALRWV